MWVPGFELLAVGFGCKHLYPLSHAVGLGKQEAMSPSILLSPLPLALRVQERTATPSFYGVFVLTQQVLLPTKKEGVTLSPDWPGIHCVGQAYIELGASLNSNRF